MVSTDSRINTIEQLEAIYGQPSQPSQVKEVTWITPHYRAMIEASPFAVLGTSGPEGLDCSPRGDLPGFVRVVDEKTLLLPDRRGNNRADSLRNIIRDPRVGLLFFLPGLDYTLRVNGRAYLSTDPALLESFVMEGKAPRCVVVIEAEAVFFQCARALLRSELWNPAKHLDPKSLPTSGQILEALSNGACGGAAYDQEWPARARASMW
jgi:PPOX class probable FMN-dependent enzyme